MLSLACVGLRPVSEARKQVEVPFLGANKAYKEDYITYDVQKIWQIV